MFRAASLLPLLLLACDPDAPPCGDGARVTPEGCVSDRPQRCALGTQLVGDTCVPDTPLRYQVLASARQVIANGYSAVNLYAFGTAADGQALTDPISWTVEPTSAGKVYPEQQRLTLLSAPAIFVPCSAARDAGCAGPARISFTLADRPGSPLTQTGPLELLRPVPVDDPAPCVGSSNVLHIRRAQMDPLLITQGTFAVRSDPQPSRRPSTSTCGRQIMRRACFGT